MWVSYPMSTFTWPTGPTDLNARGQVGATKFLSSLEHPCQSHFQAYPVFTSPSSQVARGGELTPWQRRQAPVAGGECLSLESHPSSFYTKDSTTSDVSLPACPSRRAEEKVHTSSLTVEALYFVSPARPSKGLAWPVLTLTLAVAVSDHCGSLYQAPEFPCTPIW